ncbi:acyltransferase [Salinisphaera sp. Q1T1-3]|uniref:acyltransferase family protein n=1 Tax=Salinisphaera sp. Q1T1-3 TaxID=2321229 RepID=UPI000E7702CF|nr:acyltransferase [Salinisphaera sp. Q1T1-3]RJS92180.1 acyltransferase [Salinisphaera sp. Q1T1-3]
MPVASSRIHAFDSLRGLAAVSVLVSHLFLVMQGQANAAYARFFDWTRMAAATPLHVFWQGHAAVVVFYVLSGFVLYLLLAGAQVSMPAYVAKRVVRLYVPYLAAIVLGIIGAHAVIGDTLIGFNGWINKFWSWPVTWPAIGAHLWFLGQFNADRYDFTIWTLVHEMRISLVFPLIFLMVRRLRWWAALMPFLVASVTMVALRQPAEREAMHIAGFAAHGGLTAYVYTVHYLLAFALGASLAAHRERLFAAYANLPGRTRVLLGVLTATLYVYGGRAMHVTGLTTMMPYDWPLMIAAALLLVTAAAEPGVRRLLESGPGLYLGRISYSLYLFHPLVLLAMLHVFAGHVPLGWLLAAILVMSFVISDLAHRTIEQPAVALSRTAAARVEWLRARWPAMRARAARHAATFDRMG